MSGKAPPALEIMGE
eukprot:symbB.v1.2.042199.t1/scaffold9447.1/size3244/1